MRVICNAALPMRRDVVLDRMTAINRARARARARAHGERGEAPRGLSASRRFILKRLPRESARATLLVWLAATTKWQSPPA